MSRLLQPDSPAAKQRRRRDAKKPQAPPGFTLIELMVVVAVIGILSAVALPSYFQYVIKARWANTLSTVDIIMQQAMMCQQLNNTSCSGKTGQIAPADIDMVAWPQNQYMQTVNVAFSPGGNGFHVYFSGTADAGGYYFSRGQSRLTSGSGYLATQSFQDTVPATILPAAPVNPASSGYWY